MSTDESEVVTLKVRVTPSFREQIQQAAKENNRSMNAEIVHRLENSFPSAVRVPDPRKVRRLSDLARTLYMEIQEQENNKP